MIKNEKNHNSSLRVLEILKILLNENVSKQDIIEKIKLNEDVENIYTQEAFLKYFNTLKILGFDIKKDRTKYSLNNAIYKLDLSSQEKKLLDKLIKFSAKYSSSKNENLAENIFFKLDKYVENNTFDTFKTSLLNEEIIPSDIVKNSLVKNIKNLLNDNQNVNITYRKSRNETETLTLELKDITEKRGEIFVNCYNPATCSNRNLKLNSIISVKQQPIKSANIMSKNSVIFRLYGRFSLSYNIRPTEKMLDFVTGEYITITNSEEDKDSLLLRLLKYGESCKIISPKYFKVEFFDLTDEILKNLEEESV